MSKLNKLAALRGPTVPTTIPTIPAPLPLEDPAAVAIEPSPVLEAMQAAALPVAPPVAPPADHPEDFSHLDAVSVRVSIPGHVAAAILRANPAAPTIEAAIVAILKTATTTRSLAPAMRPLYFDDIARQALERELDVNVFTPDEVVRRIAHMRRISVAGVDVPLDNIVLERLDTRKTGGTLAEYIASTVQSLMRGFVRL